MAQTKQVEIKNLAELEIMAHGLLGAAETGQQATVLALVGQLGAGKTTLVQFLGQQLGLEKSVTSPTFLLRRRYPIVHQTWSNLVHYDCYRLAESKELEELGWARDLAEPGNLICVEWADKVQDRLPTSTTWLEFTLVEGDRREIKITNL